MTFVWWHHNHIFSVWWVTNFPYQWWFTGMLCSLKVHCYWTEIIVWICASSKGRVTHRHYCPHSQSLPQFSIATRMPFHLRVTLNIAQVSIYIIHIPKVEKDCMGQRSLFYKTTWWQDQVLSPNLEIWNQMALRTSTWICYHLFSIAFSMWFKDYRHIKCGLAESQQKLSIST